MSQASIINLEISHILQEAISEKRKKNNFPCKNFVGFLICYSVGDFEIGNVKIASVAICSRSDAIFSGL